MLVTFQMSKTEELFFAVVAILILATSIFGLDSLIFRKKRTARAVAEFPKQRVHYVVEEQADDSDSEVPGRSRR